MMKRFFQQLFKKLTSRTLTMKFYCPSQSKASQMFNSLTRYFLENGDKYQILRSSIRDDYWNREQQIVFFKLKELKEGLRLNELLRNLLGETSIYRSYVEKRQSSLVIASFKGCQYALRRKN